MTEKAEGQVYKKDSSYLYIQVVNMLREEISSMRDGDVFYTDRRICKMFNVSQPTARRALSVLSREGLVERVPARGTFVRKPEKLYPGGEKTMSIGLVSYLHSEPHIMAVKGVENKASECGYSVLVSDWKNSGGETAENFDAFLSGVEDFKRRKVDGIILVSPIKRLAAGAPACLCNLNIPVVLVNWFVENSEFPAVLADYEDAAYKMTNHLISLGYESIGFIGGPLDRQAFSDRYSGYRRALHDRGMEYEPDYVYTGLPDFSNPEQEAFARKVMEEMISLDKLPRAIFAATDFIAVYLMDFTQKRGLRVPEDIAVAGFDNWSRACMFKPALTTASQPYYDMGVSAVELLNNVIGSRRPGPVKILVPSRLIVRESCGGKASDVRQTPAKSVEGGDAV